MHRENRGGDRGRADILVLSSLPEVIHRSFKTSGEVDQVARKGSFACVWSVALTSGNPLLRDISLFPRRESRRLVDMSRRDACKSRLQIAL